MQRHAQQAVDNDCVGRLAAVVDHQPDSHIALGRQRQGLREAAGARQQPTRLLLLELRRIFAFRGDMRA